MILKQGDCLELMDKMIKAGDKVDAIVTDIPYGTVTRKSNGLRDLDKGNADIFNIDIKEMLDKMCLISEGQIIIFCGKEQFSEIYGYFASKKGTVRPIVWEKTNPSPMNGQYIYLSGVELAVWFKPRGRKIFNAFCKNSVFRFSNGTRKVHPTQKNLDLITELILDNTNENEIVFDPFMGSGTTGISCVNTNRNFIGFELDENYFKTSETRIQEAFCKKNGIPMIKPEINVTSLNESA